MAKRLVARRIWAKLVVKERIGAKRTLVKLGYALAGFVAGVFTAPLMAVTWPFVLAAFIYNEKDD